MSLTMNHTAASVIGCLFIVISKNYKGKREMVTCAVEAGPLTTVFSSNARGKGIHRSEHKAKSYDNTFNKDTYSFTILFRNFNTQLSFPEILVHD